MRTFEFRKTIVPVVSDCDVNRLYLVTSCIMTSRRKGGKSINLVSTYIIQYIYKMNKVNLKHSNFKYLLRVSTCIIFIICDFMSIY